MVTAAQLNALTTIVHEIQAKTSTDAEIQSELSKLNEEQKKYKKILNLKEKPIPNQKRTPYKSTKNGNRHERRRASALAKKKV
ncbi:hypothetical protein [Acidiphilium acidophilum]|uniref:Transposase n=1 Tax=Acidiphilium acidophilum TaxID=76588 RepID=A0AAW9DPT2_ACIAO|nr:hypothetical protein [Acidiphilium acidophilum]MDX5930230.1 hypothetical protein [Acidiphilium acidophilum]